MRQDLRFILERFGLFIICSIAIGLIIGMMFIDIHWIHNSVHETSLVEITQEVLLLVMVSIFFYQAYRYPLLRHSLVLVGGFFTCMLIRELDFLMDVIRQGAWFWFASAVAAICVIFALRRPATTLTGLVAFLKHPSYGMMIAGLLCVLVFSRLFGMQILWKGILSGDYQRVAKNMAEEGTELLGYTFCLFATLWYSSSLAERHSRLLHESTC
ncbi:hypothetical protein SJI19_13695 [Acerihabitans sp. TG2]|uniref:hypothetical protein n=1 Tax=Acerihabitans sp. TG2 TaxID=3096008 RepID=UPI002B23A47B|nr:hypothetical protein [Acerihabitans sp. TG2]MEA9391583.1 hypothetical protein [Acerihabitans sp. TG2]